MTNEIDPDPAEDKPAAAGHSDEVAAPAGEVPADIKALSYEEARDELRGIVDQLHGGVESLQESLDLWERGEHLARHCQVFLDKAQARVDDVLARSQPASPTRDS